MESCGFTVGILWWSTVGALWGTVENCGLLWGGGGASDTVGAVEDLWEYCG